VKRIAVLAAGLALLDAGTRAPSIDRAFDDVFTRYRLPGLAVAVIEDDHVVYMRTAGKLVAGEEAAITPDTLFKIASNSKAMTAATIARLADKGKVRWEDPVVRHLPEFRMHDDWVTREIEVRDLVIHDTGLRSGAGDLMLWPDPNAFTRQDVLHGIRYLRPVYSFRSRYDYDNLMYIVAGEALSAAGGASYEDLVRREVFEPLGMTRCRVGEWRPSEVGNVAQPHSPSGQVIRRDGEIVPAMTMAAAGGIRCSLRDMTTWVRAWLSPGAWLSREQREAVWRPQIAMPLTRRQREWDGSHFSAYGYGWRLADVDGTLRVAHTGTLAGMYSSVAMLPEKKVGFVILINGEGEKARSVLTEVLVKRYTSGDPGLDVAHYAKLIDEEDSAPERTKPPDTSTRRPATPNELSLGTYRDPWLGDVSICTKNERVRFEVQKSPKLSGTVMRTGNRWLIAWDDDEAVDAEAWLDFAPNGTATLAKVDPNADFNYDYEDLALTRARRCE
jgi:CubicO group peptidase (beta-lactamase class C family)